MKKTLQKGLHCLRLFLVLGVLATGFNQNVAYAQNGARAIKGTVIADLDKLPVIGATVQIDGTSTVVPTDIDGHYSINAEDGQTLVFNFFGCTPVKELIVEGKDVYDVVLKEDKIQIGEVVVVGYGQMRKKEVSGAVSRLDMDEISSLSSSDLGSSLQGQVAGVNVQLTSGAPGSKANVQIRGVSSITGSNEPLYVVDGIPYEGDPGISDNEIASIDILKDAASAAIYGTRGAAGVILITTKRGKEGKMRISANASAGVQMITSNMELMNAKDYMYSRLLYNRATGAKDKNTDDMCYGSHQLYTYNMFNDNSLLDLVENNFAPTQNYSVNMSGGSENIKYNVSLGYFNQEGVIINSGFERYNFRANSTYKRDKWTVDVGFGFKIEETDSPASGILLNAYKYNCMLPMINVGDSSVELGDSEPSTVNAVASTLVTLNETTNKKNHNFNGNAQVSYEIIEGLTASTRLGINYDDTKLRQLRPLFQIYDADGEQKTTSQTRPFLKEQYSANNNISWETILNWDKDFGKHNIKATAVFSMEQYDFNSFYAQIQDLYTNEITNLNGGTSDMTVGTGKGQYQQDRTSSLVGMLARVQYNYDERYLFSASIRRDGSSRFTSANRWGYFPSVSAGWNISEENFWGDSISNVINNLKLRASMGTTGNQNFSDYAFQTAVFNHLDYVFGGEGSYIDYGRAQLAFANANVKWETTQQFNIGIDAGFLRNKLTFSLDAYQSNKSDMLFQVLVPPSAGAGLSSTVVLNVGDMMNRGLEMAISYRDKVNEDFDYRLNFTASTNRNVITSMSSNSDMYYFSDGIPVPGTNTADRVTGVKVGSEAGTYFVMQTDGLVNSAERLAEYQKLVPTAKMGDLIYVDQDGNNIIDDNDRIEAGSGAPKCELGLNAGFNFKGFDLSLNVYSSLGNKVINGSKIYTYQMATNQDLVYQWSNTNPTSEIATFRGATHANYRAYADVWVEDGSFVRLKNLTFGYSVPSSSMKSIGLNKLRFYVAGDNLVTLTKYSGYDPEVGGSSLSKRGLDLGTYPISVQVRGGIQIEF